VELNMKKFQEYMDRKGEVRGTAAVKVLADKLDVEPCSAGMTMPPKEKYGPSGGKHQPYSSNGRDVVSAKGKGFGDLGNGDKPYDVTKKGKIMNQPTAEAKFAYHELLPKVRNAIRAYPPITENLVRELQRDNLLGVLVGEMLSHNETYRHIAEVMASKNHGRGVCRKLAKAMREGVASPFHKAMDHGDEMDSGGVDPNLGLGTGGSGGPASMDFGGGDDGGLGDGSDEFGDDDGLGGDDLGDDMGSGDEFGDDEFGDDDGLGGDDMGGDDPMAKIQDLENQLAQLKAQIGGGDVGGGEGGDDEFGLGDDPGMGDDPAPDPNAVGPDGQPLPPPVGPDGQPLPPNQPPVPPAPPKGPPAMENMRRAMQSVFESYRPVVRPKKQRRTAKKR
jgi:hypothetical protein